MNVLIVSDDPHLLIDLAFVVRDLGHTPVLHSEALQYVVGRFRLGQQIDFVLLDLDGTDSGWLECAAWLEAVHPVPLAVVSSSLQDSAIVQGFETGVVGIMSHSTDRDELSDQLAQLLDLPPGRLRLN